MTNRRDSVNNRSNVDAIGGKIAAIHDATLRPGFYGAARIEWQVKDGSIQQDIKVVIEETIRLQSSQQ
jgi:hypothetical protein